MTGREPERGSALVVGGGGIGAETALAFASRGVPVTVADLSIERADAVAARVRQAGGEAHALQVDVADAGSVRRMFASAELDGAPPVEILVNTAGVIRYEPLIEQSEDGLRQMLDVNLKGSFLCLQEAARRMVVRRRGCVVNLASTASFRATRLAAAAYGMTKGGIRQLTVAAAVELAPYGIRVNAVAPGTIRTDFVQGTLDAPEGMARAVAGVPLGRIGTTADVAAAIMYLTSPEAAFVTGHVLVVDGGRIGRAG